MKEKEIDWTLVKKWIDGQVTGDERARVEGWMQADPRRRRFVEQAGWYYQNDVPLVTGERIDRAWGQFIRIQHSRRRRKLFVAASGVAASFLLLVGIWWLWKQEPVPALTDTSPVEIAAGTQRASLIMSNGTRVELQADGQLRTITDRDVDMLVDSSSLSYENNAITADTLFHTIEVPAGGEFHLTLSDGTKVWLNAKSSLTYPLTFHGNERRVRLEGEGYFEVMPGDKRFIVESRDVNIRVLGTAFNINVYEDEPVVRTTLVRGKIDISTAADTVPRVLTPGEQAIFDRESGELDVERVNPDLYIYWMQGRFVFQNTPLRDIMRTLARWYDMEYEFADPVVETIRFYGIIDRAERVKSLLDQFEKTGKVEFEYSGKKVIVKNRG